jgi:hypothetical protein
LVLWASYSQETTAHFRSLQTYYNETAESMARLL